MKGQETVLDLARNDPPKQANKQKIQTWKANRQEKTLFLPKTDPPKQTQLPLDKTKAIAQKSSQLETIQVTTGQESKLLYHTHTNFAGNYHSSHEKQN